MTYAQDTNLIASQLKSDILSLQQDKIINQLLHRKQKLKSVKTVDPVFSHLFVIGDQQSHHKRRKRIKTQRDQQQVKKARKKQKSYHQLDSVNPHKGLQHSFSVELPKISKKFQQSKNTHNKSTSDNKNSNSLPGIILKKQIKSPSRINSIRRKMYTDAGADTNYCESTIKTKSVNQTIHSQPLSKLPEKLRIKADQISSSKLEKINKNKNKKVLSKFFKQWTQIDILKMQTYFIKLKSIKIDQNLYKSKFQIDKTQKSSRIKLPSQQKISEFIKNYKTTNNQINIDNLVRSQNFGVIFQQNLYLYFGIIQNAKKTGYGVYVCNNYKYQGLWKNDQKTEGVQITGNGYYKGKFKNNKRHGQGCYYWKNGQNYSGQWKNGLKNGSGIWKSGKGDSYIGQWVNGKVQGTGVHIMISGQRYQGEFKEFLKSGKGKQSFPNGDMYEGSYYLGCPHGRGKYIWRNGIVYIGNFDNGFRSGMGVIKAQNYLQFEGHFQNDLPNGQGNLFFQNGNNYVGNFVNGQKNGEGTMNLKSQQKILTGIWKNNKFQFQ